MKELRMIDEIFDLDIALKLLYGAYLNHKKINPYDYILNSIPCHLTPLSEDSDMF